MYSSSLKGGQLSSALHVNVPGPLNASKSNLGSSSVCSEQYLNAENVPLAVEKCVNFVSAHGSDLTGVYRLAGSHVKIERLVEALKRSK